MDIEVKKNPDPVKGVYTINLYKISDEGETSLIETTQQEVLDIQDLKEVIDEISTYNIESKQRKEDYPDSEGLSRNYYFMKTLTK